MKRLNVFATTEEIREIKRAHSTPVMKMGAGPNDGWPEPIGKTVHRIALSHGLPEVTGYYGVDLQTGEFLVIA